MSVPSKSRGLVVVLAVGVALSAGVVMPRPACGGLTPQMSGTFRPEKAYDFGGFDQVSTFNGGLTLQIPLGMRYRSGAMEYGLTLSFNSAKWQYYRASGECGVWCVQESRLSLRQNAGAGWTVSLGGLLPLSRIILNSPRPIG